MGPDAQGADTTTDQSPRTRGLPEFLFLSIHTRWGLCPVMERPIPVTKDKECVSLDVSPKKEPSIAGTLGTTMTGLHSTAICAFRIAYFYAYVHGQSPLSNTSKQTLIKLKNDIHE